MDKVNEAADKLSDDVRDYVKAKVEELKPQIIEELNKGKQIIVDAAKGVVIQIRDQIVRIITGAQTGSSDEVATYGALDGRATEASSDEFEFMEKRGIADIWGKVKEAMKKLGDNIKAGAKKTIEELRPKITEALENLKKIVIDAGKKSSSKSTMRSSRSSSEITLPNLLKRCRLMFQRQTSRVMLCRVVLYVQVFVRGSICMWK